MFITEPISGILAYLDPGTGSMILQLIIAGLVGFGFAIKMFWSNIKGFCAKIFTIKDSSSGHTNESQKTAGDTDGQAQ